jgi:adenylate kinase
MSTPEIVIMGAPGAGKGTQSKRISEAYDVEHITTGDALRANKDMETDYGTPRKYMEKGELVPDAVVNEIVSEALAKADGYVLDGYPRNISQVEYLDSVADPDVVLYLDVAEAVLLERITGRRECEDCGRNFHLKFDPPGEEGVCDECGGTLYQREDDTEETARNRIRVYDDETEPVVDHYEQEGSLVRIDGEDSPDAVWESVRDVVEEHAGDP